MGMSKRHDRPDEKGNVALASPQAIKRVCRGCDIVQSYRAEISNSFQTEDADELETYAQALQRFPRGIRLSEWIDGGDHHQREEELLKLLLETWGVAEFLNKPPNELLSWVLLFHQMVLCCSPEGPRDILLDGLVMGESGLLASRCLATIIHNPLTLDSRLLDAFYRTKFPFSIKTVDPDSPKGHSSVLGTASLDGEHFFSDQRGPFMWQFDPIRWTLNVIPLSDNPLPGSHFVQLTPPPFFGDLLSSDLSEWEILVNEDGFDDLPQFRCVILAQLKKESSSSPAQVVTLLGYRVSDGVLLSSWLSSPDDPLPLTVGFGVRNHNWAWLFSFRRDLGLLVGLFWGPDMDDENDLLVRLWSVSFEDNIVLNPLPSMRFTSTLMGDDVSLLFIQVQSRRAVKITFSDGRQYRLSCSVDFDDPSSKEWMRHLQPLPSAPVHAEIRYTSKKVRGFQLFVLKNTPLTLTLCGPSTSHLFHVPLENPRSWFLGWGCPLFSCREDDQQIHLLLLFKKINHGPWILGWFDASDFYSHSPDTPSSIPLRCLRRMNLFEEKHHSSDSWNIFAGYLARDFCHLIFTCGKHREWPFKTVTFPLLPDHWTLDQWLRIKPKCTS